MSLIVENHGRIVGCRIEILFASNYHRDTCRTGVFLRSGVEKREAGMVKSLRKNVAGSIGDKRDAIGFGQCRKLCAFNRVVRGDMDIFCAVSEVQFGGNRRELVCLRTARDIDRTEAFGFLHRFARPLAGMNIIGGSALQKVHREHGELRTGSAAQKQRGIRVARQSKNSQ